MLSDYGYLGILALIALLFPVVALAMAYMFRPKKPNPAKNLTYECGLDTRGPSWVQYHPRYYLYALLFVIFDIETVFLYPWAVAYRQLGLFALVEMLIFIAILLIGFWYAWVKRALEWR